MYNSGWDQYHSKEESVSHLEVFLLISADGTTDSGTQADATDGQQDAESSDGTNDGTEGTSDGGDGDAPADQDQEQTDDENTTADESSDDDDVEEEGDDDDEEEEKEEDKKPNPILGINISSDFVLYGTHRFLRFPMAIVKCILGRKWERVRRLFFYFSFLNPSYCLYKYQKDQKLTRVCYQF